MPCVAVTAKVISRSEHNAVRRFPEPGDEGRLAGPSRNFEAFDPLDFLAEGTQHISDPGAQLIRCYERCSNETRGQRVRRQRLAAAGTEAFHSGTLPPLETRKRQWVKAPQSAAALPGLEPLQG
jgi:hypothetical protein